MTRGTPQTEQRGPAPAASTASAVHDLLAAGLDASVRITQARTGDDTGTATGIETGDAARITTAADGTVQVALRQQCYRGTPRLVSQAIRALARRGHQVRLTGYRPDGGALTATLAVGPLPEGGREATYDAGLIKARLLCSPAEPGVRGRASVAVERGQTAWNPASTKADRALRGPATCTYVWFEDGGIDVGYAPAGQPSIVDTVIQAVESRRG